MKLEKRYAELDEYYCCELTTEIDRSCGLPLNDISFISHYLLIYKKIPITKETYLLIRIPGATVGTCLIDKDGIILNIHINEDYRILNYPDDINEQLNKLFAGKKIDLENL